MNLPKRIEVASAGIGETSDSTLEARARQIALSDGRTEVNDLDREEARIQITEPTADRETSEDQISADDRPDAGVAPPSVGLQAPKVGPDDESTIAETLVREGAEEAEFDTRVRLAEDEDAQP